MATESLRGKSKRDFTTESSGLDDLNTGAFLRIADATELMAKSHVELQRERDNYKRWYEGERASRQKLELRVAALKGVITKLKKPPVVVTNED